jgi:hypothetical protein
MPFLLHTFYLLYTALYHRNLLPDRPTPEDTTLPYVQLPRSISEVLENRCNFLLHHRLLLRNTCLTTLTTITTKPRPHLLDKSEISKPTGQRRVREGRTTSERQTY